MIFLDYIYVITWLPAATVVWHHAFEGRAPCACDCTACFCPPKAKSEEMKPLVQKTEMRPLEKFYDTTFTDFVTGKASYVMVAVGSLFLLVALILAPQVEPSIAQDELLPADHPFQVVIDSSKYFPASGAGAKIMSVVIFGMNPIDRSETGMRLRNPDEQGAAQYDPAFNWNSAATQRYFNKTCAALSAETWVTTEKDKERVDCLFQTINHWVDQQKPTGIKKLPQEGSDATKTLVAWALSSDRPAGEELVGLSSGCGDGSGPATDLSNCRVQYVAIQAATPLQPRRCGAQSAPRVCTGTCALAQFTEKTREVYRYHYLWCTVQVEHYREMILMSYYRVCNSAICALADNLLVQILHELGVRRRVLAGGGLCHESQYRQRQACLCRPVKALVPRPILPSFLVLAGACLGCLRARIWVLTSPNA